MSFFNNSEFLKFSTNQNNTLLSDFTNKPKVDPKLSQKIIELCVKENEFSFTNGKLKCNVCEYYFENIDSEHFNYTTKRHIECSKHTNNLSKTSNKRKSSENLNKIDKTKRETIDDFLVFNFGFPIS